jgi:hypothetical protein
MAAYDEFELQKQQLNRQQKMAEMLLSQGQQMSQGPAGQMVSGQYVANSPLQMLNAPVNQLVGAYLSSKGDEKAAKLAEALRTKESELLNKYMGALTPTETTTELAGPYGVSGAGQNVPMPTAIEQKGPDYKSAFAAAMDPYAPAYLKAQAVEMLKPQKLGEGETLNRFDFASGKLTPIAEGGAKASPDIKYAIAVGGLPQDFTKWNPQQQAYAKQLIEGKTAAGANKFDFSNMLGKSAIGEVGPMLVNSKAAAGSAVQQADAANRILNAVNTNQIFTGAGANQKLQLAQIGDMVGATGNDAATKIANTRQAVQGLAQLTLQGRQQMKGQGAVTESEGALAQRAISGDINFTAGEIKQLAEAAKRAGKFQYNQHQQMVGALAKDQPNAVPYYQLEVNPNVFEPAGTKPASGVRAKADEIIGG